MLIAPLITGAAEAAVFTIGCALIHTHRHRAERTTHALALVAVVTVLGITFMATPEGQLNTMTEAIALAELGVWTPIQPE